MSWNWGAVEPGRAARALKVKVVSFDLAGNDPSAKFIGSTGAEYICTLDDCTCPDFSNNEKKGKRQPCKHMIRLAMEMGILNKEGRTSEEQDAHDLARMEQSLALYAWRYYVLNSPDISDGEYDDLKQHYIEMLRTNEGEG